MDDSSQCVYLINPGYLVIPRKAAPDVMTCEKCGGEMRRDMLLGFYAAGCDLQEYLAHPDDYKVYLCMNCDVAVQKWAGALVCSHRSAHAVFTGIEVSEEEG